MEQIILSGVAIVAIILFNWILGLSVKKDRKGALKEVETQRFERYEKQIEVENFLKQRYKLKNTPWWMRKGYREI